MKNKEERLQYCAAIMIQKGHCKWAYELLSQEICKISKTTAKNLDEIARNAGLEKNGRLRKFLRENFLQSC